MAADDALREMIRNEFGHVNRRLTDMGNLALERHTVVMEDVKEIKADVKEVRAESAENKLDVAKQGRDIKTLFARTGGEQRRWTFYVSIFTAGAVAVAWILKLVGVIK